MRSAGKGIHFRSAFEDIEESGRQRVNQLAKGAEIQHTVVVYDRRPVSHVINLIKGNNIDLWNERWQQSITGSFTKNICQHSNLALIVPNISDQTITPLSLSKIMATSTNI